MSWIFDRRSSAWLGASLFSGLISSAAWGHSILTSPPSRDGMDNWKEGRNPAFVQPCGPPRTSKQAVSTYGPGAKITVQFKETVTHPGCFILDFAKEGGTFQGLTVVPHNAAGGGSTYSTMVTLPTMTCDDCILRLRQVMMEGITSKTCPPATIPQSALYYSCANVALQNGVGGSDGGSPDTTPDVARASAGDAMADTSSTAQGGSGGGQGGAGGATGGTGGGGSGGSAGTTGTKSPDAAASGSGQTDGDSNTGDTTTKRNSSGGCSVVAGGDLGGNGIMVGMVAILGHLLRRRRRSGE